MSAGSHNLRLSNIIWGTRRASAAAPRRHHGPATPLTCSRDVTKLLTTSPLALNSQVRVLRLQWHRSKPNTAPPLPPLRTPPLALYAGRRLKRKVSLPSLSLVQLDRAELSRSSVRDKVHSTLSLNMLPFFSVV